jgi:5-methylthioadenosine/S-adenosylhomocysteine deaminase
MDGGRFTAVEAVPGLPRGAGAVAQDDLGAQRIDGRGCILIPGLINCHTHLWLSTLRGASDDLTLFPWLRSLAGPAGALGDGDLLRATAFGLSESLRSGTTCLCECCRYAPDVTARIATALGCRVVVGGMPPTELFGEPVPHDYPRLVATTRQAARDYRAGEGLVSFWLGAHSPYNCAPDVLRDAKRHANAMGTDFYLHLAEAREESALIQERYGRTPVQFAADLGLLDARTVAAHCVWLTDDDVRLFAQSGARIAHCPVSNAKLASGVAPIVKYRRAGIAVGLGTDSMVSNNTLSMFQEMRFSVLIQRAVSLDAAVLGAAEALRMATSDAARAIGMEREIGSIEVGKRADCVLVRATQPRALTHELALSDIVYAAQRDEIEAVFVEGEQVVARGRLTRPAAGAFGVSLVEDARRGRG